MVVLLVGSTACREKVDVEAEKAAIIKVINDETQAYIDGDYDKVVSYYVHDSLDFRLSTGADNHVFLEGWNQVDEFFRNDLLNEGETPPDETHIQATKEDFRIKVYDRSAYAVFVENWCYRTKTDTVSILSRQIRFLEKVDGEWKITFVSIIGTSGYDTPETLEDAEVTLD